MATGLDRFGRRNPNPGAAKTWVWDFGQVPPKKVEMWATDLRDALERSPELFAFASFAETEPPSDEQPKPEPEAGA
ncbi:hypothetical protein ACVWY3_002334 [Bradyrhizobium sp. USDA 4486]